MINDKILENIKNVHFIGIGGSGMYPIVQIFHSKGYHITGSDNNETETLDAVRKMGIEVFLGQRAENIKGAELIIYTAAIMADNPELIASKEAEKAGKAIVCERADILGLITSWYDDAVCVCGTHGKTTTSSMLTQIFLDEGVDLSCVIGGKLPSIGGSGRSGSSSIMVCESCEYQDHFLKFCPEVAVILNVDADHLEYFKSIENSHKAVDSVDKEKITFGFDKTNDYSAVIIGKKGLRTDFEVFCKGESAGKMAIHVPGDHNVLNALAAIAAARYEGVSWEGIRKGLDNFFGAVRRFQKIDEVKGITIVDDYAHHPKEIECTLKAAKELDFNRVWAVFQPFTYSRTKILMNDFVNALGIADVAVITDIMGSREKNTDHIYTEMLGEKIKGSVYFPTDHELVDKQTAQQKEFNFMQCVDYIAEKAADGDLVITLGCGDVYKLAKMLAQKLKEE